MTRSARAVVIAAALAAVGSVALADTPRTTPEAIEVDRDSAPAGRIGLGFDAGEPLDAWGVSITAGWIERPIQLGAGAVVGGSPASQPVRRRQTLALGGALALGDSAAIDARLRGSHQVGDRLAAAGDPARLARYVFHDLRLGGRIRVVGNRERAALLRADLTLPTGNDQQFAGDARWTLAWSLIGRATLSGGVAIAATAGIRLHGAEVIVGDKLVGDELVVGAGASVPLTALGLGGVAERVAITAGVLGGLGDDIGVRSGPSPVEAQMGLIVQILPELTLGAQVGVGIVDEIGAPRLRAVVGLAWAPRVVRRVEPAANAAPPDRTDDEPDDEADDEPDDGPR